MEDKLLIWKLNHGSSDALCRVYDKYRDDLVRIAAGLVNDMATAEDIVQDVFLKFVHSAGEFEIRTNLKGYLITCVVNKIRNLARTKDSQNFLSLENIEPVISNSKTPERSVACDEESDLLYKAMAQLPYDQKEAVILRLQGNMKFKDIAKVQAAPVKTTLSRYHYGLDKLRSLLNGKVIE